MFLSVEVTELEGRLLALALMDWEEFETVVPLVKFSYSVTVVTVSPWLVTFEGLDGYEVAAVALQFDEYLKSLGL